MRVLPTELAGVLRVEPKVWGDQRGFFLETYHSEKYRQRGIAEVFVQDNHSRSVGPILRGLHAQVKRPQGKLVRCVEGEIFDVAVDIRRGSPNFGKWVGVTLTGGSHRMLWVPEGFAHGYLVLTEHAIVLYKTTDFYAPEHERTIRWNDPDLNIRWPLETDPILNDKDRSGRLFRAAELFD